MTAYKKLVKQTLIYGLATVLPRVISFLLVGLHTQMMPSISYGEVTILLSYMIFFNVILSYGMETTFLDFIIKTKKQKVISTASVSIFWSSILFLCGALLFQKTISSYLEINKEYLNYAIWILALDALVIIPFSKLRAEQRPIKYAAIKLQMFALTCS